MSQTSREIEARGRTVDDAVRTGLSQLGLTVDDVVIDVIDEGSRGILGLGSRDAVVSLKPLAVPEPPAPPPVIAPQVSKPQQQERVKPPLPVAEVVPDEIVEQKLEDLVEDAAGESDTAVATPPTIITEDEEAELATEGNTAVDVVSTILNGMQVNATVAKRLSEEDDLTRRRVNIIDVEGDDLGVLIGQKGETLDAMQYISRLIVGHRLQHRANFVIDVEGYRERRHQALARLAERMGQKAVQRQSPVTLEAMSPYERRIIHITLRDSDQVSTASTGEGNRRRVRIYPKK